MKFDPVLTYLGTHIPRETISRFLTTISQLTTLNYCHLIPLASPILHFYKCKENYSTWIQALTEILVQKY